MLSPDLHNSQIRTATKQDAERLTQLALKSKAVWGYEADFMKACVEELRLQPGDKRLETTWLLEASDDLVGFVTLLPVDKYQVELDLLYLEPNYMGLGGGRRLFEFASERAREQGFVNMSIQADPNAAAFYQRMGAELIGQKPSGSIPGRQLPLYHMQL